MSERGIETATTSKKRKKSQDLTLFPYANCAKNPISKVDKENQLKLPTDTYMFPNLYCELRFPTYRKTNLNIEKKLALPDDLKEPIEARIQELGLGFIGPTLLWIWCTYEEAETTINTMNFDYEALKSVIATPDALWVMESTNTRPKGMLFTYLTREARTW
ncbi:hypothetical protein AHAS_Ahas20G0236800 [Arachis hypogaea]